MYNGANFYTFGGVTALFTGREISNRPACPYLYIIKTFANGFSETGEKAVRLPQIPLQASGAGETGADPRSGPRGPHGRQPPAPAAGGRAVEGGHGTPCALHARFRRPSEAWTRKYDGKNISDIDASIVTDHMMLAAASLGLDTLWICMFKPEAVREEFALPANVEPVNILLIGYGDGPAADPNRHDTLRKPLSATVFHERF